MRTRDAVALIRPAVKEVQGDWADLGAGSGAFTRALAELLPPASRIYAVDRDTEALARLQRWAESERQQVIIVAADFTGPFVLPGVAGAELDGIVLANALHFVENSSAVLRNLVKWLRPGGRVVLVEYDRRGPDRWVPHPLPAARWSEVAIASGLSSPTLRARRPSAYGGDIYVATADRG